jgi:hypothetical protein
VHKSFGVNDLAAESGRDRLVAEANPEDRDLSRKFPDGVDADSGILRPAWARGNHDGGRPEPLDIANRNAIVSDDLYFSSKHSEILEKIIGERIVVIDHEKHSFSSKQSHGQVLAAHPV